MTRTLADETLRRAAMLIGGAWCEARGGGTLPVRDPASGEGISTVPDGREADAEAAVEAAAAALPLWRALSALERGRLLRRWYELVVGAREDLARLLTLEQGKPLAEARAEVTSAAAFIEWYAEEGRRVY
jgi:succinate-semialdehyde dehydrogenase/glutarate-semialdehyde dehydrogenase